MLLLTLVVILGTTLVAVGQNAENKKEEKTECCCEKCSCQECLCGINCTECKTCLKHKECTDCMNENKCNDSIVYKNRRYCEYDNHCNYRHSYKVRNNRRCCH